MKLHDREFTVGIEPEGFGCAMVNISKPMLGWRGEEKLVRVSWGSTLCDDLDEVRRFSQALAMGIELAQRIQLDFDEGILTSEKDMQAFLVGDRARRRK